MTLVLPWQKNDKKNIHQCSSNVKLSLVGPTLFKSPLLTEIGYNAYPRLGGVNLDGQLVSTNWSLWGRLFRFLLIVQFSLATLAQLSDICHKLNAKSSQQLLATTPLPLIINLEFLALILTLLPKYFNSLMHPTSCYWYLLITYNKTIAIILHSILQ